MTKPWERGPFVMEWDSPYSEWAAKVEADVNEMVAEIKRLQKLVEQYQSLCDWCAGDMVKQADGGWYCKNGCQD